LPNRRPPTTPKKPAQRPRANFRQRYDKLESQRALLVERLKGLGDAARRHPGYKRALKLLNDLFRNSSLAQRIGILQAASWLIDILEQLPFVL
jgi:hypothetical protein